MRFESNKTPRAIAAAVLLVAAAVAPVYAGDGIADSTFGTNGVAAASENLLSYGSALAEGPDGSVLLGGEVRDFALNGHVAVVRLTARGEVDSSYGTRGGVRVNLPDVINAAAEDVHVYPDGSTLVAGFADPDGRYEIVLARFTATGVLDASFGDGGLVVESLSGWANAPRLAVDAEGRIVTACTTGRVNGSTSVVALVRYLSDGSRDATFGTGGLATFTFGRPQDGASSVAIDGDGRIVVVGYSGDAQFVHPKVGALRALPDGRLDTTFGTRGTSVFAPPGMDAVANAGRLTADGRLVFVGTAAAGNATRGYMLGRLDERGAPDATFGGGGFVFLAPPDTTGAHAEFGTLLAIQEDGKVLAGGWQRLGVLLSSPLRSHLARVSVDGVLDTAFGTSGYVEVRGPGDSKATACAALSDGRVGVAGTAFSGAASRAFAAVYLEDGTPDFRLDVPATIELSRGASGTIDVGVIRRAGHDEPVEVTAPDVRALKIKLTPTSVTTPGASASFSYKVKKKAPLGDHEVEITATDGVLTRTATVILRIVE